jgi:hypothetical protein
MSQQYAPDAGEAELPLVPKSLLTRFIRMLKTDLRAYRQQERCEVRGGEGDEAAR